MTARTFSVPVASGATPLFYDSFEYVVDRNTNYPDRLNNPFVADGPWNACKAVNASTEPNARGYLFTEFNAARGGRVLVSEVPNASNQTDHYVQCGATPADVWIRFKMYTDPASDFSASIASSTTQGSKFIYSSPDGVYPVSGGSQLWMISIARTTVTNLPAGDPVAPLGGFYIDCSARADGTEGYNSGLANRATTFGHNVTRTYFPGGTWLEIKMRMNMSGAQGSFEMWGRTVGAPTYTKYSEWIGGVTPNFVWPLAPARRIGNQAIRTPSDFGRGSNPPNSTPYSKYLWDDFGIYASDPG
jgi:hypothetical protein